VASNPDPGERVAGIITVDMDLKEIREAYRQILGAYNALFPLDPQLGKGEEETLPDCLGIDEEGTYLSTMKRLKKAHDGLKEAADGSGNFQSWRRGEPMAGLSQGLKTRIDKALKFGI
jgi:hypothetical protein